MSHTGNLKKKKSVLLFIITIISIVDHSAPNKMQQG